MNYVVYELVDGVDSHTAIVTTANSSMQSSNVKDIAIVESFIKNDITYTVDSIAPEAFIGSAITGIDIRANVKYIPSKCFQNCPNLKSVTLRESTKVISEAAFRGCGELTTITLDNVERIDMYSFYECAKLSNISLSNTKKIGDYAFFKCTNVNCPSLRSLTSVGGRAFSFCGALGDVEIPSAAEFGSHCFADSSISSLTFYDNLEEGETMKPFGNNLFYKVATLEEVVFPSHLTEIPIFQESPDLKTVNFSACPAEISIPSSAFKSCSSLETVIFPEELNSIESEAFMLTAINSVTLPKLNKIGDNAFSSSKISDLSWPETSIKTLGINIFYMNSLTSVTIPTWMTEIPQSLFSYNTNLTSIDFQNAISSLTKIGDYAFRNCALTEINLPTTVTEIGNSSFRENALTKFTFHEALKTIGSDGFYMNKISELTVPSTIESIGGSAFSTNQMKKLTIEEGVTKIDGGVFQSNSFTELTFPSSLKTIGSEAFKSCALLTTINFNNGLEFIESSAFQKCTNLTSLVIPGTVETIDESAFSDCKIADLTLNKGIVNVGNSAFYNNKLVELTLPSSIKKIGRYAFYLNKLEIVHFPDSTNASFTPIEFGASVFGYNNFKTFRFPAWLTIVPEGFLRINSLLETVTFASNTKQILNSAFENDYKLSVPEFPKTVRFYGMKSFYSCGKHLPNGQYLGTVYISGDEETGDQVIIDTQAFAEAKLEGVCFLNCLYDLKNNIFENVTSVKKIEFAPCTEEIPMGICKGWTNLETVIWPSKLTSIGKQAFYGCTKLKLESDEAGHNNILDLSKAPFFLDKEQSKDLNFGDEVFTGTTIDHIIWPKEHVDWTFGNTFKECQNLTFLSMPAWLNKISQEMFYSCTNITSISWDIDK